MAPEVRGVRAAVAANQLNATLDDIRSLAKLRALAAALALERPAMVGFSQGAPLALACAATGTISAVAVVSGTDELAGPVLRGMLPPQVRQLVESRRRTRAPPRRCSAE